MEKDVSLYLHSTSQSFPFGSLPFKFQAAWLLHRDFTRWMESEWTDEGVLTASLKGFSGKLVAWNKDVFGSIFRRKIRAKSRMSGVMKAMDEMPSVSLFKLERRLK